MLWRIAALAAAASGFACSGPAVLADVTYDARLGDAGTMDIYIPDGPAPDAGRPAVMLIHGGAWRFGSKDAYDAAAERLARAGYVAATINYRLVPAGIYPAAVQDCLCALSYLRANADAYGIDPERVAVSGYSAGGHLSSLIGVAAELPIHAPDCEWGPTGPPAAVIPGATSHTMLDADNDLVSDFMGGSEEEIPELYASASPIAQVHPDAPPYLVIHGEDDVVDVGGAVAMVDAMRAAGNQVWFLELRGGGHIFNPSTDSSQIALEAATDLPEAWAATFDFLEHTVGAP
jgi:acetyl esterase/lipase